MIVSDSLLTKMRLADDDGVFWGVGRVYAWQPCSYDAQIAQLPEYYICRSRASGRVRDMSGRVCKFD